MKHISPKAYLTDSILQKSYLAKHISNSILKYFLPLSQLIVHVQQGV